jgi:hypothetical protein
MRPPDASPDPAEHRNRSLVMRGLRGFDAHRVKIAAACQDIGTRRAPHARAGRLYRGGAAPGGATETASMLASS